MSGWPDYCSRETLAKRLDVSVSAIDQYVKRGAIPSPVHVGDALRWRWSEVDAMLRGASNVAAVNDPFLAGVARVTSEAPAPRVPRQEPNGAAVSVLATRPRRKDAGQAGPAA